jgi:hypothetical protein
MMHIKTKRFGAAAAAALYVFSTTAVFAATTCATAPTSALSVIGNHTIDFSQGNNDCKGKITLYNSPSVGANSGNLKQADAQNANQTLCVSVDTSSGTSTNVTASGTAAAARATITFSASAADTKIEASNDSQINVTSSSGVKVLNNAGVGNATDAATATKSLVGIASGGDGVVTYDSAYGSYIVTLPGGDYGTVSLSGKTKIVFSGPAKIKTLTCASSRGVQFAAGTTYIGYIDHSAGCDIYVDSAASSSNPVILDINGINEKGETKGFTLQGGPTCVNYATSDDCTAADMISQTIATMSAQDSSKLYINVLNGNFTAQNNEAWAANIYVQNGGADMGTGPLTLVGSIVANGNITMQANGNTNFYFQAVATASTDKSSYALTPPAVPAVTSTNSLIYRAVQRDYQDDGTQATSGDLVAYRLNSDSTQNSTAVWSATGKQTASIRGSKLYTQKNITFSGAASDFETLLEAQSTDAAAFTGTVGAATLTSTAAAIINPATLTTTQLAGRYKNALIGQPWRTKPIIVGNSVLFATDDGILYSVAAGETGGTLNWGWIPRQLLPQTAKYDDMALKHPWGQISSVTETTKTTDSSGVSTYVTQTYIVGTAMGGQVHFSLKVSSDGATLQGVSWVDYQASSFSPGSGTDSTGTAGSLAMAGNWSGGIPGGPAGGAAPVPPSSDTSGGATRVAYVYGNSTDGMKMVIRRLNGTDGTITPVSFKAAGNAVTSTTSTATEHISSNLLYVDDSSIYFGTNAGRVDRSDSTGQLSASPGNKDLGVTTPVINVNGSLIASSGGSGLVLTAQTAYRLIALEYLGGTWTAPLWWTGLSTDGTTSSSSSTSVPTIPVASGATMQITAAPDIMNGEIFMYVTQTTTDANTCATTVNGYAFGPLALLTGGSEVDNAKFKLTESISSSLLTLIGSGQATGGAGTTFNGVAGILASTTKNTGLLSPSSSTVKQRLNWRELTNFF